MILRGKIGSLSTAVLACVALGGCIGGTKEISANTAHDKSIRKIDGSIAVREGASVRNVKVIDGDIDIDDAAYVKNVSVTDGNARLGKKVIVNGNLKLTDGEAVAGRGTQVTGSVYARHGKLELDGVSVAGNIELFCTDATVSGSTIEGDILIEEKWLWKKCEDVKTLEIGADTEVTTVRVAVPRLNLRVHRSARIGKLIGPEPEYFE